MSQSDICPICSGAGMIGATSCGKCRGTGRIKLVEEETVPAALASEAAPEEPVEEAIDLSALVHPRSVRVKIPRLKIGQASPKRLHRGLAFKH